MRKLLIKSFFLGLLTAVICLLYGFFIEPKTLKVRSIDIAHPNWKSTPLKIALISDIHIGGWHVDPERVAKVVETINAQSPDIVLIAGDFIDGHDKARDRSDEFNAEIVRGIQALSEITAPLGAYASIGNHDDWYDGAGIKRHLLRAGVGVLENKTKSVAHDGIKFCLIGLPDSWTGKVDMSVFDTCGTESKVAFMHSPDSFKYLPANTTLALAGHTHGGQINIPLIGRRVTATEIGPKFAYGKVEFNKIPGYVTAGIGTSMLPARFRAPPEIAVITLSGTNRDFVSKH